MGPNAFGGQSEVGTLKKVLLRRPELAFASQAKLENEWERLGFLACPDYSAAVEEYDQFVEILSQTAEIVYAPESMTELSIDSIYVRDASVLTNAGMVLCNMGKRARSLEPSLFRNVYSEMGIPVITTISGRGSLEGGDVVWLKDHCLVVGSGYRTNASGIDQLRRMTFDSMSRLIVVDLPHWNGPGDVFHLMSILSPVDVNKLVVYSRAMPVVFRNALVDLGYELIEVPDEEFDTMGCNVLALAPGKSLMLSGNPVTRARLDAAGVEVVEYQGAEISLKGGGGPTCLTRPLLRERLS
jgi:N-dimethylarginine dimethylaminohydrolase